MKFVFALAVSVFFPPLFISAAENVVINEIAWMGTAVSSYCEWVELYNDGAASVDLSGWGLYEVGLTGDVLIMALTKLISASGYYVIERVTNSCPDPVSEVADDVGSFGGGGLSNAGEKLELKNTAGTIIDSVDAMNGWPAGDNTTKETMQRTSVGGWITAAMTPASPNANQSGSQAPTSDVFPPRQWRGSSISDVGANSGVTTQPTVIQEPKKLFTVDAGENIKTVAGAEVRFQGAAYGFDGKPLDETSGNVRYLWNFGDGAFFEGKNMNHVYRYPGTYHVALYVSSGETSGSDGVEVRVEESKVAISEIADAWIELANDGADAIDLSSWQIRSATATYTIPARTLIGSGAFVVFPQETTGLFFGALNPKAELRYANGTRADMLSFRGTLLSGKSIMRDEEGSAMMGEETPGRENKVYQIVGSMHQELNSKLKVQNSKPQLKTQNLESNVKKKEKNEDKNSIIHDTKYILQEKTQQSSLFSSNYFWLAASISIGLIAGAVVLALRAVVLF